VREAFRHEFADDVEVAESVGLLLIGLCFGST
jgi:hypothetical protein